jgi:hypothetical protein
MYSPSDKITSTVPHEILALVGAPGVGKSISTLTFPHRLYGDCDHKVPPGEPSIPYWDATWTTASMKMVKRHEKDPANYRDAIKKWLRENLPKFSPEQTYIHDSWTQNISMAMMQIRLEDELQGSKNKFFIWQEVKKYCEELAGYLKSAPCRVVVTFHETPEWLEGEPTGKIKPVQDGQYKDQLFSIYTDVYRCLNGIRTRVADPGGKLITKTIEGRYWQVQGDASFDTNANGTLAPLLRKHNIKYIRTWIDNEGAVKGGYQEIQRIYNSATSNEVLKVSPEGILL